MSEPTTVDECLANRTIPTELSQGDTVSEGIFYRHLKRKEVSKRFAQDEDDAPGFGYKIRKEHWKEAAQPNRGQFSIDSSECIGGPECSILLKHPKSTGKHVLEINLQHLRNNFQNTVLAVYAPISEDAYETPCHFELIDEECDDATFIMSLRDFIEQDVPSGDRVPTGDNEVKAREQLELWQQVFTIYKLG